MSRRIHAAIVGAIIPYLLISGSERATLRTTVYLNGSGKRTIEAVTTPDRQTEIARWLRDSGIGSEPVVIVHKPGADTVTIRRSRVAANFQQLGQQVRLYIQDILQSPLTIYTYYRWSEELEIKWDPATKIELAGQPQAYFNYELSLPGRVLPDTLQPANGEVDRGKVTWRLSSAVSQYTIQATSRTIRWGYLLLVLYILAFVTYRVAVYIDRMLAYRPRKI